MRHLAITILLCCQLVAQAQFTTGAGHFPVKGELVTVNDWGSRSLYFISTTFFAETKDSILLQTGQQEFDEMEKKCGVSGWPKGFYIAGLPPEEDKIFDAKLNKLKMYKIAAYTHIYNGKLFARHVILRIPFEENRSWDPGIQWEGNIYFLLEEKDVAPAG
jgi:hypothetical protein